MCQNSCGCQSWFNPCGCYQQPYYPPCNGHGAGPFGTMVFIVIVAIVLLMVNDAQNAERRQQRSYRPLPSVQLNA